MEQMAFMIGKGARCRLVGKRVSQYRDGKITYFDLRVNPAMVWSWVYPKLCSCCWLSLLSLWLQTSDARMETWRGRRHVTAYGWSATDSQWNRGPLNEMSARLSGCWLGHYFQHTKCVQCSLTAFTWEMWLLWIAYWDIFNLGNWACKLLRLFCKSR